MVAEPKKKAKKAEPLDYDGPVMVVDTSVGEEDVEVADKPESKKPKPGEPDFDWSADYPGEQVFVYTKPNSEVTVGLAAISKKRQPSIGFMRESRRKPEFEQVLDMLELVASDNALAVVDSWTAEELLLMWNERTEWNQTHAGE